MAHQYRSGTSPFSRPQTGDVFRIPATGLYWTVLSGMHDVVDYVVSNDQEGLDQLVTRVISRKTWIERCSRQKAEFITGRIAR
jgi:hypothetical protein